MISFFITYNFKLELAFFFVLQPLFGDFMYTVVSLSQVTQKF